MSSIKQKVKELEEKILTNNCEDCNCTEGCKNKELRDALEDKIKILKGNKTVLK